MTGGITYPGSILDFAAARNEMVARQIRARGILSPRVLGAMASVARHEFVPTEAQASAYSDEPLPIGGGQTISQPYMVAVMTDALLLSGAERVLEIGGGCGYQAAILSLLAREVIVVELQPALARASRERLARLGYSQRSRRRRRRFARLACRRAVRCHSCIRGRSGDSSTAARTACRSRPSGNSRRRFRPPRLVAPHKAPERPRAGITVRLPLRAIARPLRLANQHSGCSPGNRGEMNAPVPAPELSIVIPAYNEEGRLARTLSRIREYFAGRSVPPGVAPNHPMGPARNPDRG